MSTARQRAHATRARLRALTFDAVERRLRPHVAAAVDRAREGLRHIPDGPAAQAAQHAVDTAAAMLARRATAAACHGARLRAIRAEATLAHGPTPASPRTIAALRAAMWAATAAWCLRGSGPHPTPASAECAVSEALREASIARTA